MIDSLIVEGMYVNSLLPASCYAKSANFARYNLLFMQDYAASLTEYKRLKTIEVNAGGLLIGNYNPIRLQTMTTTDTMDTEGTVSQTIRCIEAGAELVRITAPSKKEAENLLNIKRSLRQKGYSVPLVADIHFTPNAAEIAARIIEKVRINPGNYVDKKKFEQIEYTDAEYREEIERIHSRFTPLLKICKEYGTAMRIGTNHGSLSDRIMSRYGDTPMGMVESAMEFLRIARDENYHNIVLSMKASNPQVMVQAYRLLVHTMYKEFGVCYPLHLGVTEAGDGEDGRIKSAVGIGTLLEDGIGDTVRVSLTEEPELEIPVCKDLVDRYSKATVPVIQESKAADAVNLKGFSPFSYKKRETFPVHHIGGDHPPIVIANLGNFKNIFPQDLKDIGYIYDVENDKWHINDIAADYVYIENSSIDFALPGTLKIILPFEQWVKVSEHEKYFPLLTWEQYIDDTTRKSSLLNFLYLNAELDLSVLEESLLEKLKTDQTIVLCIGSTSISFMQTLRAFISRMYELGLKHPIVFMLNSEGNTIDQRLIHYSVESGALLIDGYGDGLFLEYPIAENQVHTPLRIINSIAFGILQATRTRISKTEYISCPSCGRTLFDLQETTAKIRSVTHHLKGVKIAIMGCIVNGPGEMADADFGYVGSGVGKITLYKGKEVVKRNIDSDVAVDELIDLLKESKVWVNPSGIVATEVSA